MTNKEAIEFLKIIDSRYPSSLESTFNDECERIALNMGIQALKERPQGEWILVDDTEKFIAKCSVCGRTEDSRMIKYHPFCHCGARMKGSDNE